jgi:hypothetical protein
MCHKTASLVANALEAGGIATVVIGTMHKPLEAVARAVVTHHINAPAARRAIRRLIIRLLLKR